MVRSSFNLVESGAIGHLHNMQLTTPLQKKVNAVYFFTIRLKLSVNKNISKRLLTLQDVRCFYFTQGSGDHLEPNPVFAKDKSSFGGSSNQEAVFSR